MTTEDKIIEYKVLRHVDLDTLGASVTISLKDGWELRGGLHLGIVSQGVLINYHQVMVKKKVREHKCY